MTDRLTEMFEQQRAFMELLREKRGFPEFPVDLSSKPGQKFCKGIAHEAMGELFEAVQELRNSKGHRATDIAEFDRVHYVEELVDSLHYFLELVIASGVSADELFAAYISKGDTNVQRITSGY